MNCNWLVADRANKEQDILRYIRDNTERLSDERYRLIAEMKKRNYEDLKNLWKFIPDSYKRPDLYKYNISCA